MENEYEETFLLLCMGIFLLSGISVYAQEKGEVGSIVAEEIVERVIEIESKEIGELPEYVILKFSIVVRSYNGFQRG